MKILSAEAITEISIFARENIFPTSTFQEKISDLKSPREIPSFVSL
jgi:hypothetical protein